jgi:outer membrane protein OmpA-like peptidoglycan-associated protein
MSIRIRDSRSSQQSRAKAGLVPAALLILLAVPGCKPAATAPNPAATDTAAPALAQAPVPPPAQAPEPQPAKPPLPERVVLDGSVLKSAGSGWKLAPPGLEALKRAAEQARAFGPGLAVAVTGYSSSTGARAQNLAVSRQRALFVAKSLIREGLPTEKLTVKGLGPEHPVADNATREGRLKNQRVEIVFQEP